MRLACLAIVLGLGALACNAVEPEDVTPGASGGKADGAGDSGELPVLDESYALLMTSILQVRDNETGELSSIETRAGALLAVAQDGASIHFSAEPCYVSPPEVGGRQPELGEGVVESMAAVAFDGALVEEEGGVRLLSNPAALQLGVDLEDPLADALPDDEDDPRVVDFDQDDRPGVSVYVSGFRIYVGVRVIFALSALVEDAGEISGASELTLDTAIYGDNIPFYSARNAAEEAAETSDVVGEDNTFVMRSLAGGTELPSCDDVVP